MYIRTYTHNTHAHTRTIHHIFSQAEYEERLESALSSSESRRTPQSATDLGSVEGLTEYKVLQKHAHQIADLEEQIQATKTENNKCVYTRVLPFDTF